MGRSAVAESTIHVTAPCTIRVRTQLFLLLPEVELGPELETVTLPAISVGEKREMRDEDRYKSEVGYDVHCSNVGRV